MPSRVDNQHRQTSESHHHDKSPEDFRNKNWAHKEALHVALGSILAPKRPHIPPNSRSSSGTLTPAHSNSHTPGTGTPVHPPPFGSEYLHPHHAYLYRDNHHATHTPSRLAQSSSNSQESSPKSSAHSSPKLPAAHPPLALQIPEPEEDSLRLPSAQDAYVPPPSPGLGPIDDSDPRLRPLRPTLAPLQTPHGANNAKAVSLPEGVPPTATGPDGKRKVVVPIGSPKAKFFETLQGKSAWDALIHGSFS